MDDRPSDGESLAVRLWRRRALWLRPDVFAAGAVVVVAAVLLVLWWPRPGPAVVPTEQRLPLAVPATVPAPDVLVHVAGAVVRPGLYRLPPGSRVADLLQAAGGATAAAQVDAVNLAAPLVDGERVVVPRRGETVPPLVERGQGSGPATVDVNHATAPELEALPGVGPALAAAIVAHRTEHGPFASVEELAEVSGIGPATVAGFAERAVAG